MIRATAELSFRVVVCQPPRHSPYSFITDTVRKVDTWYHRRRAISPSPFFGQMILMHFTELSRLLPTGCINAVYLSRFDLNSSWPVPPHREDRVHTIYGFDVGLLQICSKTAK